MLGALLNISGGNVSAAVPRQFWTLRLALERPMAQQRAELFAGDCRKASAIAFLPVKGF